MGLYLLDYGAGNVQSLANSLKKLGHQFTWITQPSDFAKATSLIFPGVGAFETAIQHLTKRGLFEPLRDYISSGRPYFGICIGMQVLFESSEESPSKGLGIIPCHISRFSNSDKSVPHMGWNTADRLPLQPMQDNNMDTQQDIEVPSYYYFVHSYCAKYDPERYSQAMGWTYTTTQYGDELFISIVKKDNIFGTQFHPEKSGTAGLKLIDEWLTNKPETEPPIISHRPIIHLTPKPQHNFTKRVIACMDVRTNDAGDLVVTKGDQYDVREKQSSTSTSTSSLSSSSPNIATQVKTAGQVRNLGKPINLASKYYNLGADELCLLNITSFRQSPLHDQPMLSVVHAASQQLFVPLTIGGGIKDTIDPDGTKRNALEVASAYFRAGADKVSIGSEAVYAVERLLAGEVGEGREEGAIESIARVYGSQAVVVSIDPKRVYVNPETYSGPYRSELVFGSKEGPENERGKAWWYQCTVSGGRESRPLSVVQLAKGVEQLGAGEILVNSIDRDGTGLGFDLDLVKLVKRNVKIPVVASSGAGCAEHFVEVFRETGAEAALAAGIFHRDQVGIQEVKEALRSAAINARRIDM